MVLVKRLFEFKKKAIKQYNNAPFNYMELSGDEIWKKEFDIKLLDSFTEKFDKAARLCDVGCGATGQIGQYLFNKGFKVCGIDISKTSILAASKLNPLIDYKVMDMKNLIFENESLDGIVAFYSIIHIPKNIVKKVFSEFKRVLKQGGRLFLAVHKGEGEHVLSKAFGDESNQHLSYFSVTEIIQYLTEGGFDFEFIETRNPYDFEFQTQRIYAQAIKRK